MHDGACPCDVSKTSQVSTKVVARDFLFGVMLTVVSLVCFGPFLAMERPKGFFGTFELCDPTLSGGGMSRFQSFCAPPSFSNLSMPRHLFPISLCPVIFFQSLCAPPSFSNLSVPHHLFQSFCAPPSFSNLSVPRHLFPLLALLAHAAL